MADNTVAPFGSWRSPIAAATVAAGGVGLQQVQAEGEMLYWLEMRPAEGGRYALVRWTADGGIEDVVPAGFNARTRVHEYGGGAYVVHHGTVYCSDFADQRLYRLDPGDEPRPITPEPSVPAGLRYADGRVTPDGRWLICVRESHAEGREAANEIVVLPTDSSAEPRAIVSGADFYAFPRISPDGRQLAWTSWDHPRMPWDGTELWVADLAPDGSLGKPRRIADGPEESIFQPEWGPDGGLHFVSDRTGWWNLYRLQAEAVVPLAPVDAELGAPQWAFGMSTYAFLPDGSIACIVTSNGLQGLGRIRPGSRGIEPVASPYQAFPRTSIAAIGNRLAFVGASPTEAPQVAILDPDGGEVDVLRTTLPPLDREYVSPGRPIEFPTEGGLTAHAFFYPPSNRDFVGPAGERPPLIVVSHGGPTGMTSAELDLEVQYWTSRGLAVVDVNYGGSTGFGRAYRERLNGRWGMVDTADCINAAKWLAQQGEVDGKRLAIRGGSAGGYTTLCALVFHVVFTAGASYYGVADPSLLATDTHKFESRYLDGLIGPYPAAKALYDARSPLLHADRLSCPVILFQGLEDKIVPPEQAEAMVEALRKKGLPFAYLAFEGEQHGFRKAETIVRTLEAELYFYGRVFGFEPADAIEPVPIENL